MPRRRTRRVLVTHYSCMLLCQYTRCTPPQLTVPQHIQSLTVGWTPATTHHRCCLRVTKTTRETALSAQYIHGERENRKRPPSCFFIPMAAANFSTLALAFQALFLGLEGPRGHQTIERAETHRLRAPGAHFRSENYTDYDIFLCT